MIVLSEAVEAVQTQLADAVNRANASPAGSGRKLYWLGRASGLSSALYLLGHITHAEWLASVHIEDPITDCSAEVRA